MISGSVNFDRAAGYYDETRTHSPEIEAQVTAVLGAELSGRGRCLEAGVGTGRIALPLHRAGTPMAGVDISPKMLDRLVEKAGGRIPFPLALADATMLPFPDGVFGAGLAAHVLHLIPPWRQALGELVRVVRPGGVAIVLMRGQREEFKALRDRFLAAGGLERVHLGLSDSDSLDQAFEEFGALGRTLPEITERGDFRPAELIDRLERGEYSYTWRMEEPARRRAAAEVREWARAALGPLDQPRPSQHVIRYRAYDLP